jgi:hypothetical protein
MAKTTNGKIIREVGGLAGAGGYLVVETNDGQRYGPFQDTTTYRVETVAEVREWAKAKGITLAASVTTRRNDEVQGVG